MGLPLFNENLTDQSVRKMLENAEHAAAFLKALAHTGRLSILCHLVAGEKSVTELEELTSMRQAAVSQQLSRLRHEGLVEPKRDGQTVRYRLADEHIIQLMDVLHDMFCKAD